MSRVWSNSRVAVAIEQTIFDVHARHTPTHNLPIEGLPAVDRRRAGVGLSVGPNREIQNRTYVPGCLQLHKELVNSLGIDRKELENKITSNLLSIRAMNIAGQQFPLQRNKRLTLQTSRCPFNNRASSRNNGTDERASRRPGCLVERPYRSGDRD